MHKYSSRHQVFVKNLLSPRLHSSAYDLNSWEADKVDTVILKPALSTQCVLRQSDFHRETMFQNKHTLTHTCTGRYTHRYTNAYMYTCMHTHT